ncbi:DegT/DnrJ/EryC1/StrS aminotransferase family protein [Nocardia sp. 348MFTsu5.1]|uniref:DegT/DnrJ/EryC1/StrS family aminotransferase n=1 Tax=Nocardia sp. 348MFTsu5.1 TaxID=1172185 RepID=UPI00036A9C53|nr:DegT/DnrJ/EryC1/StrS family aminotransferase [Nocardia sp. 348MFTsu5.1]
MTIERLAPRTEVPFVDLVAQFDEIAGEVMPQLQRVLQSAAYIGGTAVADFESAYAGFSGARHCVGVGNGTDAIELALRAIGVGSGDEVILPTNSFIATAEAVSRAGATPVLVDVDPHYLLIDPEQVEAAITARTRAIIPVHLFGQSAPVEKLVDIAARHDVAIIEDAAQSQGASRFGVPAGTTGIAAGTSFYPGKNLGAAGDAGAVLTNDESVAERIRTIAAHGSRQKYVHDVVGLNSRLDAIQAVILQAKLARLEGWNNLRRSAAECYSEMLAPIEGVRTPTSAPGNIDVWHLYVVQVENRDRVLEDLGAAGIGAGIHYPTPIHLTGAYGEGYRTGQFPVSEQAARRILSLPLFPHISTAQQEFVADRLSLIVGGTR